MTVELLPRAWRFFQEANPGVGVQLYDMSTEETLRGLRDGKLHAVLTIQVSAKVLAGLVFEELHRYAVCVAMHPAHPLARVRKIGLEQLANERLIKRAHRNAPVWKFRADRCNKYSYWVLA